MRVANKKVIVRTLADAVHAGYLPLSGFCESSEGEPCISLLGLDGRITTMQLAGIRYIAFVRDFNLADSSDPERLARRTFPGRPRSEGLWLRLTLANGGGMLEGLAPLDRSLFESLVEDRGVLLTPPDIRSNTQRLFVPHAAVTGVQILAVVTTPSKAKTPQPAPRSADQESLFPEP